MLAVCILSSEINMFVWAEVAPNGSLDPPLNSECYGCSAHALNFLLVSFHHTISLKSVSSVIS